MVFYETDAERVLSQERIIQIARDIKATNQKHALRNQALFVLEYLTAGRVGEIIKRVKRRDILYKAKKLHQFIIIQNFYTEKNPDAPRRTMTIPYWNETELGDMLKEYLDTLEEEDYLFTFGRTTAWKILSKTISKYKAKSKINRFMNANHYMRHCRNTHLVTIYKFNDQQLRKWNAWSSSQPASKYSHLNTEDIENQLISSSNTE